MVVPDRHDDLGGEVLGRAAKCERLVVDLLRETKVSDFHVAVGGDQ